MSLSHPKCTDKSFVGTAGMRCNAPMVTKGHDDMNIYAASVALLWTTAMHPARAAPLRAHEQESLPAAGVTAAEGPQGRPWRRPAVMRRPGCTGP